MREFSQAEYRQAGPLSSTVTATERDSFVFVIRRNQACSTVIGKVRPGTLDKCDQAIAKADQVVDVDKEPEHPGEQAGKLQPLEINDGIRAPDRGEATLINIAKRLLWPAHGDALLNQPGHIATLLHGGGRNAGDRSPALTEARGVANPKIVGRLGYAQIGIDPHAPAAIHLRAQPLASRRGRHPRAPDHRLAGDPLTIDSHPTAVDLLSRRVAPDFPAQM